MRELGAFYEQKQRDIHDYLRLNANSVASVEGISSYTGLGKDEIEVIVDQDTNLSRGYGGDYIRRYDD